MSADLDAEKSPDGGTIHLENSEEISQSSKEELARYLWLISMILEQQLSSLQGLSKS
jgi:hypothetical protein